MVRAAWPRSVTPSLADGIGVSPLICEGVRMNCPACQTVMREREKELVIVDVCPACHGMWLDHGELEKLVEIEGERDGRYKRYYEEDDDDDGDRSRRRSAQAGGATYQQQQPRKKKGF